MPQYLAALLTVGRLAYGITIKRDRRICGQHRAGFLLLIHLLGNNSRLGCGHAANVFGSRFRMRPGFIDINGLDRELDADLLQ